MWPRRNDAKRGSARRGLWLAAVAAVAAVAAGGCFSTHSVGADGVAALRQGNRREPIVIDRARLSPVESVRVGDAAGQWSLFVPGEQLYVGASGLYARDRWKGAPRWTRWPWERLRVAEIRSLSGVKTMAAVLGVPIAIAGMFGGGLHALAEVSKAEDAAAPEPGGPLPGDVLREPAEPVVPLFAGKVHRRSLLLAIASVQSGAEVAGPGLGMGATAGIRLRELVDFELGFRHAVHRDYARSGAALPGGDPDDLPREDLRGYFGVFRFGFHFPLDPSNRLAIPLGVEAGFGTGSYFRANLGLRIQLTELMFAGLYPFSPTWVGLPDDADPGDKAFWSFQSGVELGVSL